MVLTNFSQEFHHIKKGLTIRYIEKIVETSNAFMHSDSTASNPTTIVPEPDFDKDTSLHMIKQQQLTGATKILPGNGENDQVRKTEDLCLAGRQIPANVRRYFEMGAGRGQTVRENERAFERWRFLPRVLRGVSQRRLETSLLEQSVSMPVCIAPTALHKLVNAEGEVATAKACARVGTVMVLSIFSTVSMEEVRKAAPNCSLWLQVYLYQNRAITRSQVERAEQLEFGAIVLTADSPVIGSVETEADDWEARGIRCANFDEWGMEAARPAFWDAGATWDDLEWLRSVTALPIVVKGILRRDDALLAAEHGAAAILVSNHGGRQLDGTITTVCASLKYDALLAAEHGAAAILVSNHGGRQLDGTITTLEALGEISTTVRGLPIEVYVDGGVRDAADVAKALALGAKAAFIGRPVVRALAQKGEDGVATLLENFRKDLDRILALLGCPSVDDIDSSFLRRQDFSRESLEEQSVQEA
ncbi:2-Hydroxyacid oxidase 1-like [Dermacentor variabilis]|uniref:2-Hydroxyacid oxidase 1-like n=1 Tax=Dermacentor variabilis TaxID=34621 RepID=UPI003F5C4F05